MTVSQVYPPAPDGACLIPLTNGGFTIVDAADYERVMRFRWQFNHGRAQRVFWTDGQPHSVFLHRFILEPPDDREIDHINGDALDNRRTNLRLATRAQNVWNSARRRTSSSPYKGVRWEPRIKGWIAQITVNGQHRHLGVFDTAEAGALAYNAAATQLFGDFARPNVLPDGTSDPTERTVQPRADVRQSTTYRADLSEQMKALWDDPAFRVKMDEAFNAPEVRAAHSERMRRQWNDPATREKRLAGGQSTRLGEHIASLPAEERSRIARKGAETRRRNAEQRAPEEQAEYQARSSAVHSAAMKAYRASLSPEEKSRRGRKGVETRRRRAEERRAAEESPPML